MGHVPPRFLLTAWGCILAKVKAWQQWGGCGGGGMISAPKAGHGVAAWLDSMPGSSRGDSGGMELCPPTAAAAQSCATPHWLQMHLAYVQYVAFWPAMAQ